MSHGTCRSGIRLISFLPFACAGPDLVDTAELSAEATVSTDHQSMDLVPETSLDGRICPRRFGISSDGETQVIPYCANFDISVPGHYPQVEVLHLSMHGANRKAVTHYRNIEFITTDNGFAATTMILAPQFPSEEDIVEQELDSTHAYWTGGWASGSRSVSSDDNPRSLRVSSFGYLDHMIYSIVRGFSLPNLKRIVISGHSAGGQMIHRHAAASMLDTDSLPVRFIIANPSSYLYFSAERWDRDAGIFSLPSESKVAECPEYNDWRYGLSNIYSYMQQTGIGELRENYLRRDVVVLIGTDDNDPEHEYLGTNCQSMLQGAHRLERSLLFHDHLVDWHGELPHPFSAVYGVGHSSIGIFSSPCGLKHVFERTTNDPCDLSLVTVDSVTSDR